MNKPSRFAALLPSSENRISDKALLFAGLVRSAAQPRAVRFVRPLAFVPRPRRRRLEQTSRIADNAAKLWFDTAVAALLLVLSAPVLLMIAVAVRLDGGPALYSHMRVGAGGRKFGCLKFRSMVTNGDEVLAEHLRTDPDAAAEWQATRKLRRDPRVTAIGGFLRKSSLDELPQLFNVLRGDMSLVGPRPIVENELVHYAGNVDYYLSTRPGITGLWQVSGRSGTSYARRVELDSMYVSNWTMKSDFAILAKTVSVVLKRTGAV